MAFLPGFTEVIKFVVLNAAFHKILEKAGRSNAALRGRLTNPISEKRIHI